MLNWIKNLKSRKNIVSVKKETRLEQMKKNPYKRVDSENMTDIEKMDQGFNGKTFTINGIEVDFNLINKKFYTLPLRNLLYTPDSNLKDY